MSKSDETKFDADDLRLFAPPGTVEISPAALDLARGLLGAVRAREQADWIVVFDWAHTSVKKRPGQEARDLGWLLGYGASKRDDVPGQMIHRLNDVEFAVQVPADVIAQSKQRLIDAEPSAFFGKSSCDRAAKIREGQGSDRILNSGSAPGSVSRYASLAKEGERFHVP